MPSRKDTMKFIVDNDLKSRLRGFSKNSIIELNERVDNLLKDGGDVETKWKRLKLKTDASPELAEATKKLVGGETVRSRKQSSPKKNAKTIPQQTARKELTTGKRQTRRTAPAGQAVIRNPPPGMTKVPVDMLKRSVASSMAKGKFKVTKKVQPKQQYLKRNVRAGASGALMTKKKAQAKTIEEEISNLMRVSDLQDRRKK